MKVEINSMVSNLVYKKLVRKYI